MKNVVVIFGGKSVEHDISIITGLQILSHLKKDYCVFPIYIARNGEWWTGQKLFNIKTYSNFDTSGLNKCYFVPHCKKLFISKLVKTKKVCISNVILALHGVNGEDGTIQGLFELCEIPYTSAGVMGSSLTMDKVLCKSVLKYADINTPDFISFYTSEWELNPKAILKEIKEKFNNKVVIKPARAGSSIGVASCSNVKEIEQAICVAKSFDYKIIVEQALEDFQEVNIACMGIENEVELSACEEINAKSKILDFNKKYIDSNYTERIVDVKLESEIKSKIQNMAKTAFKVCECMGVVRMDFFVENKTGKVWLNEINSIPGSMANYLWKDLSFEKLIDKLIAFSEKRREKQNNLTYLYRSEALVNFDSVKSKKIKK